MRASSVDSSCSSAGPASGATYSPLSPNWRALACTARDPRTTAAPTASANATATTPATRQTSRTTSKSWPDRNIALAVPMTPAITATTATSATSVIDQRNDRRRVR